MTLPILIVSNIQLKLMLTVAMNKETQGISRLTSSRILDTSLSQVYPIIKYYENLVQAISSFHTAHQLSLL